MNKIKKYLATLVVLTLGVSLLPVQVLAVVRTPAAAPVIVAPVVAAPEEAAPEIVALEVAPFLPFEIVESVIDLFPVAGDFGVTVDGEDASTDGPDLIVSNIYRDETDVLVIQMTNQGNETVIDDTGTTKIWIDGVVAWTYTWSTLNEEAGLKDFMVAGETSAIMPQILRDEEGLFSEEGHLVKACIDYNEKVSETNEDNNCTEATILSNAVADVSYPNLVMSDIYLEEGTDELVIEMSNDGDEDVTDLSGKTYIWIDDVLEWTYSWSTLADANRLFLTAGESSTIHPQTLFGGDGDATSATVTACVDYLEVIDEGDDEGDNCRTVNLVERVTRDFPDTTREIVMTIDEVDEEPTGSPDLVVSDIYRDEGSGELVFHLTNQGDTAATDSSGETHVWIDGELAWSYDWASLLDQDFMAAGQTSAVRPQADIRDDGEFTTGEHFVEVCVDFTDVISESDETNNCDSATILSEPDEAILYSDLKVTNVYLQRDTNYLIIDLTNAGEEDVADLTGQTSIWVDDMSSPAWVHTWTYLSDEDRAFLQVGETSTIQPQVLFGNSASDVTNATVMVCVDYDETGDGVAIESDEINNCLTVDIEEASFPQTYDTSLVAYGVVMGSSYPATASDTRIDFERSSWSEWLHDSPTSIHPRNQVAFGPSGILYYNAYAKVAWLNSLRAWADFSWCASSANPATCNHLSPKVDLELIGPLAGTGDAYWSGRAYVSKTSSWINFDWTCAIVVGDCSLEDRVHTDLETGEVSGYAWGGAAFGWVNFGNDEEQQYMTAQTLPEETDTIYVQPIVTLTPDPEDVTKYGQGGGDNAPLADGSEHYSLSVKLLDVDTRNALTDEYDVSITVNPTADSHVYYNQRDRVLSTDSAVFFGEISYDSYDDTFTLPIYSYAPTSNVNGFDQDADGDVDFYFDHDPLDASGYSRTDDANKYIIDSIDIEVTGPTPVEFAEIGGGEAPLWNLSGEQLDLKFAPAIEITNLGRWSDSVDGVVYSIPSVPDREFPMTGLVAAWSESGDFENLSFDIIATLNSSAYYYVFDTNSDGNYVANSEGGDDYARARSRFNVYTMGWDTDAYQAFVDTGYYVPISSSTTMAGLGDGTIGDDIQLTMLVNDDGYIPVVAQAPQQSLFARLINWINPFGPSLQANAAGSGPDLTISDVYLQGTQLKVDIENIGNMNVTPEGNAPHIQIEIEGVKTLTYSHSSLADTDFMNAGGSTTLNPYSLSSAGQYTVNVCVDSTEAIVELSETNNCMTVEFDTRNLPDLEVTNVYRDDISSEIVVVLENTGSADAVPYLSDPYIYFYIDGVREWSDSYRSFDDSFLDAGGSTEVRKTPGEDEPSQYLMEVCVDSRSAIAESNENNNCFSTTITSVTLYPDLMISAIYFDENSEELVIEQRNIGSGAATNTSGVTKLWIDGVEEGEHPWSRMPDPGFMAVGGTSELRSSIGEANYSVQACIDFTGVETETDENNNCTFATVGSGANISPLYDTLISYTAPNGEDVVYYSNYMPLTAGTADGYNVPAYDSKLEPDVSGSVTTAEELAADSSIENVGGDLETKEVRNQLYTRFKQLTKGADPDGGGTITGEMEISGGASLMGDSILYFTGDVVLEDIGVDYEEVTIGVIGGDVYIDSNILGESVGILVFRDANGNGGNVKIHPDVTDVKIHVFADGGVYSYDGDLDSVTSPDYLGYPNVRTNWDYNTRQETLSNQLAWYGSLVADITLTGTLYPSNMFLPDGEETNDRLLAAESCLMDLREFVLCWVQTDEYGSGIDLYGDPEYPDNLTGLGFDDMEECDGAQRATTLEYTGDVDVDNHTPLYFEYEPPSSTLPVFSRTS